MTPLLRPSGAIGRAATQRQSLVTAGKRNKQVAGDLGLSEITVKSAAMRKMGARTLADLVLMAEALQLGDGKEEPCLSC